MTFEKPDSDWTKKGNTLSDKSARKEFGLTQEEIIEAIKADKLQYRQNNVFGNPYLRLLRNEVEALVNDKYGSNYLKKKQLKKELAQTKRDLKKLKTQINSLEKRKAELQASLDEYE
jgi:hypothetical protein